MHFSHSRSNEISMKSRYFGIFALLVFFRDNNIALGLTAGSLIWSRNDLSFIPIEKVPSFRAERQHHLRKSRELESHNFQKKILRIAYYEEENIVHFYENDTRITGVCGELWNMLEEYLNFTMVTLKTENNHFGVPLPNGSFDGLLGMLTRNEIQIIPRTGYYVAESKAMAYTTPVWDNCYRLYIRPESKADSTWIIRMFTRKAWCSILLLFVLLSVSGYGMQKISMRVSGDERSHHNLHDHLFYTFATFCCQGFIPDSLYHRAKILGFSKKMFAWLLLMTISSHLISWITNQKDHPPFEDLGTMFNSTTYNIVVFNGSIVFEKFKKTARALGVIKRYKSRFFYVNTPKRLYEKGCWGKRKYAILDSEDRQRAYGRFQCNLVAAGMSYFPTWVAAGVSKTFKYKRSLDIGILKLNEFGLTDGLKDRWMATSVINVEPVFVHSVNFHEVSLLFVLLSLGTIIATIVFILEYMIFLYRHNQRRIKRRIKRRKTFNPRGKIMY